MKNAEEKTKVGALKAEAAAGYFKEGYNCAQSVLLAFLDETKLDRETALKLSSSFGGGMGRLREVCGAVSALFMVAGLLKGYNSPNDDTAKALHYELIQKLAGEFKKSYGTIICRELLGLEKPPAAAAGPVDVKMQSEANGSSTKPKSSVNPDFSPVPSKRTEEYYAKRPCEAFIQTAAEIAAKNLL